MKTKKLVFIMLAIATLTGYYIKNNVTIKKVEASEIIGQIIEAQPDALDAWLVKLHKKENCGKGIVDVDGSIPKGDFCYKDSTLSMYSKKYGTRDQWKLTKLVILNEKKGLNNWYCSVYGCPKWGIKGIGEPKF